MISQSQSKLHKLQLINGLFRRWPSVPRNDVLYVSPKNCRVRLNHGLAPSRKDEERFAKWLTKACAPLAYYRHSDPKINDALNTIEGYLATAANEPIRATDDLVAAISLLASFTPDDLDNLRGKVALNDELLIKVDETLRPTEAIDYSYHYRWRPTGPAGTIVDLANEKFKSAPIIGIPTFANLSAAAVWPDDISIKNMDAARELVSKAGIHTAEQLKQVLENKQDQVLARVPTGAAYALIAYLRRLEAEEAFKAGLV